MQYLPKDKARLEKLNRLLAKLWEFNPFYAHRWCQAGLKPHPLSSLNDLSAYPLMTRAELIADQAAHPPLGSNLTEPFSAYKRFHCSSGTTQSPIYWADTLESWIWLRQVSEKLYRLAGISASDRIFFTKPLGRSLGPWSLHEGASKLSAAILNPGTTDIAEQIEWLKLFRPTVLVGRPEHLVALAEQIPALEVQKNVLAGGGPEALLLKLSRKWNIPCFDRYGLTEAGSVASECAAHSGGLHLLDEDFIAESITLITHEPVPDGQLGELVLTNLGRSARPIIRYRTCDRVCLIRRFACSCGRTGSFLKGPVSRLSES